MRKINISRFVESHGPSYYYSTRLLTHFLNIRKLLMWDEVYLGHRLYY